MPGLITRAVPMTGVYITGFPHGRSAQIGIYDPCLPGMQNKMVPCPGGFENHAVPMLRRLAASDSSWVFIDEIGYLESHSEPYMAALRNLFDQKQVIAAVRKQDLPFLLEMRTRPDVFCMDLDAPFGRTGCVIMASGLSKRFGSNKLLADFHGEPMFMRILAATEGMFHRRVVVTRHPEIADICHQHGVSAVLHALPHRSDTVRLGLEAVGDVDSCLFCPADQPLLTKETTASIVLAGAHDPHSIWRPSFEGTPGSPVLFPRWSFDQLMNLPEGKGGAFVARMHPEKVRILPVQNAYELMDADDPETLEKLLNPTSC